MGDRPAQLLMRHRLMSDRLHHIRAGHGHVGGVLHHEDEVGHRRRVDRAAGAGAHDERDLGHDARGDDIALEDLGVAGEARNTLLDAGAAGIIEADHRRADLEGLVHDLTDLLGVRLRQAAAEHGEVLTEGEDQPAVDGAVAGDHTVARDLLLLHAEVGAAMLDEHVPFFEGAGIEQEVETFARGELALGVLRLHPLAAAASAGGGALLLEAAENILHQRSLGVAATPLRNTTIRPVTPAA